MVPQDQDDGFPPRLRQNRRRQTIADIVAAVLHDTAHLAGQFNSPINAGTQEDFHGFYMHWSQDGIEIERFSHDADIPSLCPSVSPATISDESRRIGQTMFTSVDERFIGMTDS
jgi:hypothetical protein